VSAFVIRRLLQAVLVVFLMSLIVFFGVNVIGDPIDMLINPEADQAEIDRAIRALGLDKPIGEQYLYFLKGVGVGDFGRSFIFGEPALKLILHHMPATIELAVAALLMAVFIGIPLGLLAGLFPDHWASKAVMAGSILGFSLPTFWVGLMMIIALLKISLVIRLTRAGVREAVHQDYIKFARAKGLSRTRVVGVHLLKNILIPVVTVLGLEFGSLLAFSVVTETIFAWPGMGKLLIDSLLQLDRPVVVAYLMIIVMVFVVINLLVDILYSVLDPRVRLRDQGA